MLNILASILSYDIWFYLSHIILHRSLYMYHREHHVNTRPKFLDTYVGHWTESPFQGAGMFFPFVVFHYSALDVILILTFLNARGMMRHDDRFVFLVGDHHLIHHLHPQYNYGEYWLDWLGGTLKPLRSV